MDKQITQPAETTEQLILDAALREFSIKGFDGARTATIAAEAGVTHAMLHYYFRTKEQLFQTICREKMKLIFNNILLPHINGDCSVRQCVVDIINAHFNFLLNNRELPLFLITTLNSRSDVFRQTINQVVDLDDSLQRLQQKLDVGAENGEISRVNVRDLVCDIVSLNVVPFIATPMMMTIMSQSDVSAFFESRKRENIELILKRIS